MTFQVGDTVKLVRDMYVQKTTGYGGFTVAEGDEVEVRRVGSARTLIRRERSERYGGPVSGWIDNEYIESADPNAPKPRKLGEKPEGDHIDVDDPRIAWIWEDAGRLATQKQYCSQYDTLTNALGIPGRERSFKVSATVAGLTVSTSVKARSRKLAEAMVEAKLGGIAEAVES